MAQGCVLIVDDRPPIVLGAQHERILSVCSRPTEPDELVDLLVEVTGTDLATVQRAIDELVGAEALVILPIE